MNVEESSSSYSNIYEVEKIIAKRIINGHLRYLVKWENFPLDQSTWEPIEHLSNVTHLIEEYETKSVIKMQSNTSINKIQN